MSKNNKQYLCSIDTRVFVHPEKAGTDQFVSNETVDKMLVNFDDLRKISTWWTLETDIQPFTVGVRVIRWPMKYSSLAAAKYEFAVKLFTDWRAKKGPALRLGIDESDVDLRYLASLVRVEFVAPVRKL